MPQARGTSQRLGALAKSVGLSVTPALADVPIVGACALDPGRAGCIAYAEGRSQLAALDATRATAVIVPAELANATQSATVIADNPRLAFARIARFFLPSRPEPGIHTTAVIDDSAVLDVSVHVGPHVVIGAHAIIAANVVIGATSVIGSSVRIGAGTCIGSHVSVGDGVRIGERVRIEPNTVIGGRGFGLVHNGKGWEDVPQLGSVTISDDVEIGAGSTIDCGALDDTIVGDGVKIDDQVHIAHNCRIGANTVIAGCTGIAGSSVIGANCMIGGGVGIGDHVRIGDRVIITAASQVPKDIDRAGVYSSTLRAMPAAGWRKRLALFRRLDRFEHRLRRIERSDKTTGDD